MVTILTGDCIEQMKTLPNESVHCCVTSPPYWGLRDYGVAGQIGLEPTPETYVAKMVDVFREVRRILRPDGICFLNLGDSYFSSLTSSENKYSLKETLTEEEIYEVANNLKPKDLCGIPWRVAFALQADGWYLRQDIIWSKPNPMPESVTDRCTKSHEYIFLLAKSAKYYYDADAIKEKTVTNDDVLRDRETTKLNNVPGRKQMEGLVSNNYEMRNKRSVWTIATQPFSEWNETVHWKRVERDEFFYGMKRIAFRGCPVHANQDRLDGVYVVDYLSHILHNDIYPGKELRVASPEISKPTYLLDLADHISWSKIWPGDLDDHPLVQIFFRSVSKSSLPISPNCLCEYYQKITEKSSHFATFPPDLVRLCILAGTSERGCCPDCGSPWERVVETSKTFESGSGKSGNPITGKQDLSANETNSTPDIRMGPTIKSRTTGWRPTCDCMVYFWEEDALGNQVKGIPTPVSCTVLDPFGGSGTVGEVAEEEGRNSILIELHPAYVKLAEKRTAQQGLFCNARGGVNPRG